MCTLSWTAKGTRLTARIPRLRTDKLRCVDEWREDQGISEMLLASPGRRTNTAGGLHNALVA
jgi:hypothetical protein